MWGGTTELTEIGISITFQSTHPVWGGTLEQILSVRPIRISIHPPRVGWDAIKIVDPEAPGIISIHPPRVGWDPIAEKTQTESILFQSTHPVWGGTSKKNK